MIGVRRERPGLTERRDTECCGQPRRKLHGSAAVPGSDDYYHAGLACQHHLRSHAVIDLIAAQRAVHDVNLAFDAIDQRLDQTVEGAAREQFQYMHLGFGGEAKDTVSTVAREHASTMRAMRDDIGAPAVWVGVVVRVAVG